MSGDAPRPALDAATLSQLRWAVGRLRGVRYRSEGDYFQAEATILSNAAALLAAAAREERLASELARYGAALGAATARVELLDRALRDIAAACRPYWSGPERTSIVEQIERIAKAALAPAAGADAGGGARAAETTVTLPIALRPREGGDGWRAEVSIGGAWVWGEGVTRYAAVEDVLISLADRMGLLADSDRLGPGPAREYAALRKWAGG